MWGSWGAAAGGGGGRLVGAAVRVLACAWLWGASSGAVIDGEQGRDIYGQELARPAMKGTNASRPTTISRPGLP
jgi:hypothetical protein